MMNEYVKAAKDFLKACNAKMSISFKEYNKYFDNGTDYRNIYNVRIDRNGMTYKFTFGDSVHNTLNHKRPTCYDVLACLQKYSVGDLDDFCAEFGYQINSYEDLKRISKIHKAVTREYAKVERIFGDVMDELREIW